MSGETVLYDLKDGIALVTMNRTRVLNALDQELLRGLDRALDATLMAKGPLALRFSMEAIHGGLEMGLDGALAWEAHLFGLCAGTRDSKEGLRAFLEKRKPDFQGR